MHSLVCVPVALCQGGESRRTENAANTYLGPLTRKHISEESGHRLMHFRLELMCQPLVWDIHHLTYCGGMKFVPLEMSTRRTIIAEASGDTYVPCGVIECSIPPLAQRAKWNNTFVNVMNYGHLGSSDPSSTSRSPSHPPQRRRPFSVHPRGNQWRYTNPDPHPQRSSEHYL